MKKIDLFLASTKTNYHDILQNYAKEKGLDIGEIKRTDKGKPYLENNSFFFSISHSGDFLICAIADFEIGIDLQIHRKCNYKKISSRYYHEAERKYCQDRIKFFDVFSYKESYVKCIGIGITKDFNQFSVIKDNKLVASLGSYHFIKIPLLPNYSCCICGTRSFENLDFNYKLFD